MALEQCRHAGTPGVTDRFAEVGRLLVGMGDDVPIDGAAKRRAGVSSFGLGGTNAHIILEEAPVATPPRSRRSEWRRAALILVAALSLLGQGERFRVDPRFRSPSTTLLAYWEALRQGDGDSAYECFVEGRHDLPVPGALWFLPPTDDLWLTGFRSLPVTAGRVMVTYEVHYRPRRVGEERMFKTGSSGSGSPAPSASRRSRRSGRARASEAVVRRWVADAR